MHHNLGGDVLEALVVDDADRLHLVPAAHAQPLLGGHRHVLDDALEVGRQRSATGMVRTLLLRLAAVLAGLVVRGRCWLDGLVRRRRVGNLRVFCPGLSLGGPEAEHQLHQLVAG